MLKRYGEDVGVDEDDNVDDEDDDEEELRRAATELGPQVAALKERKGWNWAQAVQHRHDLQDRRYPVFP